MNFKLEGVAKVRDVKGIIKEVGRTFANIPIDDQRIYSFRLKTIDESSGIPDQTYRSQMIGELDLLMHLTPAEMNTGLGKVGK